MKEFIISVLGGIVWFILMYIFATWLDGKR